MLQTFIDIVHVFVCVVLMGVVLLQQGKGGGMGAAFGGATTQVFGGRGAGNLLTRATAICAAIFMLTSVSLAYLSSSGDRALKARVTQEANRKHDKGQLKERTKEPAPSESAAPSAPAPSESAPAPSESAPSGSAPSPTP
jgi:preprotein translocase subunit SecG